MQEAKNVMKKPTLDYLLHKGYVIRSQNGAGNMIYVLTLAGEVYFGADPFKAEGSQ